MEFTLKAKLPTSAKEIYDAWLSSDGHSKMTGGQAQMSEELGGSFTAWDGYITGKNLELEANRKIVQSWRTSQFEEDDPDSRLEIHLSEIDGVTLLTLHHTNLPESGEHYRAGWDNHYFQPMQKYFSQNND